MIISSLIHTQKNVPVTAVQIPERKARLNFGSQSDQLETPYSRAIKHLPKGKQDGSLTNEQEVEYVTLLLWKE